MNSTHTIGVLGGGQLAQMLIQAAQALPPSIGALELVPLVKTLSDPAALQARDAVLGHDRDPASLAKLFQRVSRIIFENEFVDVDLLLRVSSELGKAEDFFFPRLDAIRVLQDKWEQKLLLTQLGIPSAPGEVFTGSSGELAAWLRTLIARSVLGPTEQGQTSSWQHGIVLKWSRQAYDGKGVKILSAEKLRDPASLPAVFEDALAFAEDALKNPRMDPANRLYAEALMNFKRELAIIAVRSQSEFITYPVVISEQEQGICKRVYGPAEAFDLPRSAQQSVILAAQRLGEGLKLTGAYALELFELSDGRVIVNEIAPRVHNSGHYTQDAAMCSQFENHLRAAMGVPLGQAQSRGIFAMLNLLDPAASPASNAPKPQAPATGDSLPPPKLPLNAPEQPYRAFLHWYFKRGSAPRRKLGHLNAVWNESTPTSFPAPASLPTPNEKLHVLTHALELIEGHWKQELRKGPPDG